MRVLLLNLGVDSLQTANKSLASQGYDVAAHRGVAVDQVLELSPEVLVTEATPSDLSCCGIITQLKARPETELSLNIVMIVQGGAVERALALDLGADDVISFPFEEAEFAARIRAQFRERKRQEELKTMLKYVMQREHLADVALQLSSGGLGKRRLWLVPTIFLLTMAAVLTAIDLGISNRGTRKETRQLRANIATLSRGLGQQGELLNRADPTRGSVNALSHSAPAAHDALTAHSDYLRKKMASANVSDAASLKLQLANTQSRLKLLESEARVAETVVHDYGPSVCLLHVVVEFLDKQSGRPIQLAVDASGKTLVDNKGMAQLDVGGVGPHLQIDVFGTGFVVSRNGKIVTNHHVVEPWWIDQEMQQLVEQGAAAYVLSYEVYFPGKAEGLRAKLGRISSKADVATLQLESPLPSNFAVLELDDRRESAVTGNPVVLIGYPTGIEGILARAGTDVAQKITGAPQNVNRIMSLLASERLIRPTTTQGHIGDVLEDKIVYDAATSSGGSGGPLFNRDGKVIGINFAVLKNFGGSNLAVPAKYAKELLAGPDIRTSGRSR
jgi:S1-C subfamily serine protease